MIQLFAAPMQGYTEVAFRHFHRELYGVQGLSYLSPFARIEKGMPKARDLRDLTCELNENHSPEGQVIFKDETEFKMLVDVFVANGVRRINLNIGCPFVPQCRRGRGAAMVANVSVLNKVRECMSDFEDVDFSLKMRLGLKEDDEWKQSVDVINSMPLRYVAVHGRVGADQYGGEVRHASFAELAEAIRHPLVYNGDLTSPEDIDRVLSVYPGLAGVMIGRGFVGRPSIFNEWVEGESWSREKRLEYMLRLHTMILEHYQSVLCGQSQVLAKIKPFWDYAEWDIGRKVRKAISKAGTMDKYLSAVFDVF